MQWFIEVQTIISSQPTAASAAASVEEGISIRWRWMIPTFDGIGLLLLESNFLSLKRNSCEKITSPDLEDVNWQPHSTFLNPPSKSGSRIDAWRVSSFASRFLFFDSFSACLILLLLLFSFLFLSSRSSTEWIFHHLFQQTRDREWHWPGLMLILTSLHTCLLLQPLLPTDRITGFEEEQMVQINPLVKPHRTWYDLQSANLELDHLFLVCYEDQDRKVSYHDQRVPMVAVVKLETQCIEEE